MSDNNCIAEINENVTVQDGAIVGFKYKEGCGPTMVKGSGAIRRGTTIYADCQIGEYWLWKTI